MVQKVSIILCSLSARERLWCAHRTPWIFLPVPLKILGSWVIHLPAHTMKSAYVHVDLNKRQRNTVMYNLTLCLRLFDIVLMRQNCRLSLGFDTQVCMLSLHDQCRIIIFLFLPHFLFYLSAYSSFMLNVVLIILFIPVLYYNWFVFIFNSLGKVLKRKDKN